MTDIISVQIASCSLFLKWLPPRSIWHRSQWLKWCEIFFTERLVSVNNRYAIDWWRSYWSPLKRKLNVSVYHSPARIEMGIPCHFGPSLCQSERRLLSTDPLQCSSAGQQPILHLGPRCAASLCMCLFINRLLFFSRAGGTSQVHISSLLEVEQNSWLESWAARCLAFNRGSCITESDAAKASLRRLRLLIRVGQEERRKTV